MADPQLLRTYFFKDLHFHLPSLLPWRKILEMSNMKFMQVIQWQIYSLELNCHLKLKLNCHHCIIYKPNCYLAILFSILRFYKQFYFEIKCHKCHFPLLHQVIFFFQIMTRRILFQQSGTTGDVLKVFSSFHPFFFFFLD